MAVHELRQLVRTRVSAIQRRTAVVSQLKTLLEGQCPGITRALKDLNGVYVQAFLRDWKTSESCPSFDEWVTRQSNKKTRQALERRVSILKYWCCGTFGRGTKR